MTAAGLAAATGMIVDDDGAAQQAPPAQQTETQPDNNPERSLATSIHAPSVPTTKLNGTVRATGLLEALDSLEGLDSAHGFPHAPNDNAPTIDDDIIGELDAPLPYPRSQNWPLSHIGEPCQRVQFIDKQQIAFFDERREDYLLFSIWGEEATADLQDKAVESLSNSIYVLRGETPDITPPKKAANAGRDDAPISYIVGGLTESTRAFFLDQFCFSLPDITFFVHPLLVELPVWVCALQGFWNVDLTKIRNGIITTLRDDKAFCSLIKEFRPNNAALTMLTDEQAIEAILQSIDTQLLKEKIDAKTNDYKVNLYIQPPTSDIAEYRRFQTHLRRRNYLIVKCGTGRPWQPIRCSGCHGVDHMRGLCPFPSVPGWNGSQTKRDIAVLSRINAKLERQQRGNNNANRHQNSQRDQREFTQGSSRGGFGGGRRERTTYGRQF